MLNRHALIVSLLLAISVSVWAAAVEPDFTQTRKDLLDGDHGFDQSRIQSRDASGFQDKGVVLPTVAPDASLILGITFDNEPHTRVGGNIGED